MFFPELDYFAKNHVTTLHKSPGLGQNVMHFLLYFVDYCMLTIDCCKPVVEAVVCCKLVVEAAKLVEGILDGKSVP